MNHTAISRLESHLGRLLLGGVLSSAVCLAVGLILWLTTAAPAVANGLLSAGLFILMATPILRVVVSLVEYVRMRDWFFVTTTFVVLIVLFVTIAVAVMNARA
jgi:uncharacterized membrane protein